MMADQPDQQGRLELQYRAAREDLRPTNQEDLGCAIVFAMIALVLLGFIAGSIGFDWRSSSITPSRLILVAVLGLLAGGSIIAVCGRLTRYRWWGNVGWKEGLMRRDRWKDGG